MLYACFLNNRILIIQSFRHDVMVCRVVLKALLACGMFGANSSMVLGANFSIMFGWCHGQKFHLCILCFGCFHDKVISCCYALLKHFACVALMCFVHTSVDRLHDTQVMDSGFGFLYCVMICSSL